LSILIGLALTLVSCQVAETDEFSIIIAGLAVGVPGAEDLPALAAAYVLLMAVTGPLAAKLADPGHSRAAVG
jgi:predicted Kef-type K+ transport protein